MAKVHEVSQPPFERAFVVVLSETELLYLAKLVGRTTTQDDREVMGGDYPEDGLLDDLYDTLTDSLGEVV